MAKLNKTRLRVLGAALAVLASVAWASGGGAGGSNNSNGSNNSSNHVQSKSDKDLEAQIKARLDAQQWDDALVMLDAARAKEPQNADWWNYTGYARRKSGHLAEAFPAYEEALRLDPRHLGAHEYLGELYLQSDKPDMARKMLAELETLCGHCEQYEDLDEAVEEYAKAHPG